MKKSGNLSGTDWMYQFNLWDLLISSYWNIMNMLSSDAKKLKTELKNVTQKFFSEGLRRCKK